MQFSTTLLHRFEKIRPAVERIMKDIHRTNEEQWRREAKDKTNFHAGSYVMLYTPRHSKLDLPWSGPFEVIRKMPDRNEIYEIADIATRDHQQVHVNRLHDFHAGKMSRAELIAETTKSNEFYIDSVRKHRIDRNGEIWFFVDWTGYPQSEDEDPNSDGWVSFADSHWSPIVKAYIAEQNLQPAIRRRNSRLGHPPRS